MTGLLKLPDADLAALGDEKLLEHIVRARAWGEAEYAAQATKILIWRFWGRLGSYVKARVPKEHAAEIAEKSLESALKAAFDGETIQEFRALLFVIAARRCADHHRSHQPDLRPLSEEHEGTDLYTGHQASSPDETAFIATHQLYRQTLDALSPPHKMIIELCLIEGHDSDSAAKKVNQAHPESDPPMTANNADQIKRRFRTAFKKRLKENGTDSNG